MRSVQATKQQLVTVCRRYSAYTLLAAGMVALAACGGGGGGGSISDPVITPTVTPTPTTVTPTPAVVANTDTTPLNPRYTGKRELAVLTEAVALDFLVLGEFKWSIGPIHPIMILLKSPLTISSEPVDCQMGGKFSKTVKKSSSDDGLSTTSVSQLTYDKCSDVSAVIDGSIDVTSTETYGSPKTFTETYNYNLSTVSSLADTTTTNVYDGTISSNTTGVKLSVNQNMYIKEGDREILRVNLERLGEGGEIQGTITEMDGRIYLGDYGYVTPSVSQPLSFSRMVVSTGELILKGANNTKAQMLPASSTTFVLNTDEDGDGAYEKTRIVNWADVEGI